MLLFASIALDSCWGHHQDGSDLLVNEHVLFDIVFNTVIKNMQISLKKIDKILGESCKNINWCGSCESPHSNDCETCNKAYWKARAFVEHTVEEWKRIFGDKK